MNTYIIAEVGPNHNGSLDMALEYIDQLALTDVDAVKFQLGNPDETYSLDAFKADYQIRSEKSKSPIEMAKKHQLKPKDHKILFNRCKEKNIDYLCSCFDLGSLVYLDNNINLKYYKVPSGEIFSLDIIDYISKKDKPIILSTGMATFEEVEIALGLLNAKIKKNITILHCTSNYPAPVQDINLKVMLELKKRFNYNVGYSDHTLGSEASLSAVALGAKVIEKHVTMDKKLPGPDHQASSTIEEFSELVKSIRVIEKILGSNKKTFSKHENAIASVARKSIIAKRNIPANKIITEKDICYKRPGTGFLPIEKNKVIGKKTNVSILANRIIKKEFIEKD